MTNRKLDWVLGVSTDMRAWILSCPTPVSVPRSNHRPVADGRELVMKVTWKHELGESDRLIMG